MLNVCYAHVFWGSAKRENRHPRCGIRRLFRKCLVIVGPNTKTRNERNRVSRPLFFDRSATIIGRLGHHVETRNRKPAGTSMAGCVLPICSARQREMSVILSFFPGNLCSTPLRTFLSAHSGIPRTVEPSPSPPSLPPFSFRSSAAISRGIYGGFVAPVYHREETFCFRAISQMLFRIRLGKLHEIPSDEERFANKSYKKADTISTESSHNRTRTLLLISLIELYGLRETNPLTNIQLIGNCERNDNIP